MAVRKVIARNSQDLSAVLGLSNAEHSALPLRWKIPEDSGLTAIML